VGKASDWLLGVSSGRGCPFGVAEEADPADESGHANPAGIGIVVVVIRRDGCESEFPGCPIDGTMAL
jgi:hypothetical protein